MRLLVTADLHYDTRRSREGVEELAERVLRIGGDVLVLVGDTAGAEHDPMRECLELFGGFGGGKFLVLGNHCLWCLEGEDSIQRYERIVPALAAEAGFAVLDHEPARIDGIGLVGSIGWYDYSYRQEDLAIPMEFYRAKVSPGAAERLPEHRHLVDRFRGQLADWHMNVTTRWMDGVHVRMDMTDEEFLEYVLKRLRRQLEDLEADASIRQVLAFVHHLPVRQLLPEGRPPEIAFAAAFLGSDRIGQALLKCTKLTHVFCGHSHWRGACRIGDVEIVNIGSTYSQKHLEIVDIQ